MHSISKCNSLLQELVSVYEGCSESNTFYFVMLAHVNIQQRKYSVLSNKHYWRNSMEKKSNLGIITEKSFDCTQLILEVRMHVWHWIFLSLSDLRQYFSSYWCVSLENPRLDELPMLFIHLDDSEEKLKCFFKRKHPSFRVCGRRLGCSVSQEATRSRQRQLKCREVAFDEFLDTACLFAVLQSLSLNSGVLHQSLMKFTAVQIASIRDSYVLLKTCLKLQKYK